jgi:hypothetical protein
MWKEKSHTFLNEWQQTDCRMDVCHMTTNRGSHRVPVSRHAVHIRALIYKKRLIELTNPQHQLRNIT